MAAKAASAPAARGYVWRLADAPAAGGAGGPDPVAEVAVRSDGAGPPLRFLDPTGPDGAPSARPGPGAPWPIPVDVTLSLINEPPPGVPANVDVEEPPAPAPGLVDRLLGRRPVAPPRFVVARPVAAGAELLVDYGPLFERDPGAYRASAERSIEEARAELEATLERAVARGAGAGEGAGAGAGEGAGEGEGEGEGEARR